MARRAPQLQEGLLASLSVPFGKGEAAGRARLRFFARPTSGDERDQYDSGERRETDHGMIPPMTQFEAIQSRQFSMRSVSTRFMWATLSVTIVAFSASA